MKTRTLTLTLPTDREVRVTRRFDAPRDLVFRALTTPEILKRWMLGPDGWALAVCRIDLRVGGAYRHVWRKPDGREMGMGGVYREVEPPARLVCTELFDDDWTGGETVVTTTLEERAGVTTLTSTILFASRTARDAARGTGFDTGMEHAYDTLADVLAEGATR
jgi:uncharacterized protein YndB with AHSA1/START domain